VKRTIPLGLITTNKDLSRFPMVTLKRGQYTWKVYAIDQNRHKQIKVGGSTLNVR
jgi:hypothetical protein